MNRRQVLKSAVASSLAFFILDETLLGGGGNPSSPLSSTLTIDLEDIRFAALKQIDGTVEVTDTIVPGIQNFLPSRYPIALVRTGASTISAVSKECPHNQCQVNKYNGSRFVCPCHGSQFMGTGARVSGPTPGPLPSYPVSIAGNIATISGLAGNNNWVISDIESPDVPSAIALLSSAPNPFHSETTVLFTLAVPAQVLLTVTDQLGREVIRLAEGYLPAGQHRSIVHGSALLVGTYFITLSAGRYVESRKIVKVR